MKKIFYLIAVMTLLVACDPPGTAQRNSLWQLMNEYPLIAGDALIDTLEHWNEKYPKWCDVRVSRADIDQRPLTGGIYFNPKTGTTLRFTLDEQQDSIVTIGMVQVKKGDGISDPDKDPREVMWWGGGDFPVRSFGRSLYMAYQTDSITDSLGVVTPRRWFGGAVLYVYPGGEKLMSTYLCKKRTAEFTFCKD